MLQSRRLTARGAATREPGVYPPGDLGDLGVRLEDQVACNPLGRTPSRGERPTSDRAPPYSVFASPPSSIFTHVPVGSGSPSWTGSFSHP
jgi:hypothetical protein